MVHVKISKPFKKSLVEKSYTIFVQLSLWHDHVMLNITHHVRSKIVIFVHRCPVMEIFDRL